MHNLLVGRLLTKRRFYLCLGSYSTASNSDALAVTHVLSSNSGISYQATYCVPELQSVKVFLQTPTTVIPSPAQSQSLGGPLPESLHN